MDGAPIFFLSGDGGHPSIPTPHTSPRRLAGTILHSLHPNTPISTHTAEDALEGLYFAFSSILRCLPYFFLKTRPRASYDLLEALLPSCGQCGVTSAAGGHNPTFHAHIWEPGILKVGLSITPEPVIRIRDGDALGARFGVPSSEPHPTISLSCLHPARPSSSRRPRLPTHAPTPTPHTPTPHTPTPKRPHPTKKKI